MKWKATLRVPRFQKSRYRQVLHEYLSEEITKAAFVWLTAVLEEIPVWSGASHATFLHLSREVGYQLVINPKVISRISYGQSHGGGEITADPAKGLYTFSYETSLEHLIYNEFNNANIAPDPDLFYRLIRPGPYMFQKKGFAALQSVAKGVRLPSPTVAIKTVAKRV
jgi:hypothetical protein